MKIVPTYRLLLFVGFIVLPLTLLLPAVGAAIAPAIAVAAAVAGIAIIDAYRSRGRLLGIRAMLPEVLRVSEGREGNFNLQIENEKLTVRRIRLGLAFPEEIYTPAVELGVELPKDNPISSITWSLKGSRQGRYRIDRCYLETASFWGLWSVRKASQVNMEIRVYPNLYEERKNLSALFLNRGLGIHSQRQIGKGRDFEQLREYLPGDSFEDIHWKSTARRGLPITKVYQIERTQQIYVIIDASRLSARAAGGNCPPGQDKEAQRQSEEFITMLQRFITAALIMALAAERQGDLFGLLTFDDKVRVFLKAKMGRAHFNACRDSLYTMQPQKVSPDFAELFTFIGTRIRRRALLVFLTHLDDPLLADSFTRHIDLISRNHVVLVNMIKPMAVKPLFSSDSVSSVNDIYDELGGHMIWRRMRETQKVLQRRGAGFAMLDNENLCPELISQYLTLKRRQVL
ncbi:MAG: DUF58 domain-containing protein [Deltaproteobacteria bacterium]|jgi:uncharacterized protein (DUF58 family)